MRVRKKQLREPLKRKILNSKKLIQYDIFITFGGKKLLNQN